MAFKKGVSGNPDGKPKGRQNEITAKVKEAFAYLLENNIGSLQSDIDSLTPKERVSVILILAEFVVPKLSREENLNLNKDLDAKPVVGIYLPDNGRGDCNIPIVAKPNN